MKLTSREYLIDRNGEKVTIGSYIDISYGIDNPCGFSNVKLLNIYKKDIDYIEIEVDYSGTKVSSFVDLSRVEYVLKREKVESLNDILESVVSEEPDMVNHPPHYTSETGLEVIDVIEAFTFDLKGIEAVDTAQILRYVCRWKKKNGLQDLKKAQWYINHLIEHVEKLEKENANDN